MIQVVGLSNNSYKSITNTAWVRARICKLQKGCTRFAAASDKVYQLLAHGRWFSPGTSASSTTKTGRLDITEILLKVALNAKNQSIIFQNMNKYIVEIEMYKVSHNITSTGYSYVKYERCVFRIRFELRRSVAVRTVNKCIYNFKTFNLLCIEQIYHVWEG